MARSLVRVHRRGGRIVRSHTRKARRSILNVNLPLDSKTKVYFGINRRLGPYAGLSYRPMKKLRINPRVNLKYGPSAKAEYRITKRIGASAVIAPNRVDANIVARVNRRTEARVGIDQVGPYGQVRYGRSGVKFRR